MELEDELDIIEDLLNVTFDSNGSDDEYEPLQVEYGSHLEKPEDPERKLRNFNGWYYEKKVEDDSGEDDSKKKIFWDFEEDIVEFDLPLIADWKIPKWLILLFTLLGTGLIIGGIMVGDLICGTDGDYSAELENQSYNEESATVTPVTIKYASNDHLVSFEIEGDTENNIDDVTIDDGGYVEEPVEPVMEGYIFEGWYLDSACTIKWDYSKDVVRNDMVLYAKWIPEIYTVSFNTSGGTAIDSVEAEYNMTISNPGSPTKSGYTFSGWYTNTSYSNAWNFSNDTVTSNTVLYAKWVKVEEDQTVEEQPTVVQPAEPVNTEKENYTVTFHTNGGTAIEDAVVTENNIVTRPTDPELDGYEFTGWFTDEDCTIPYNFSTVITSDLDLYAGWEPEDSTLKFVSNGGTTVTDMVSHLRSVFKQYGDCLFIGGLF